MRQNNDLNIGYALLLDSLNVGDAHFMFIKLSDRASPIFSEFSVCQWGHTGF